MTGDMDCTQYHAMRECILGGPDEALYSEIQNVTFWKLLVYSGFNNIFLDILRLSVQGCMLHHPACRAVKPREQFDVWFRFWYRTTEVWKYDQYKSERRSNPDGHFRTGWGSFGGA